MNNKIIGFDYSGQTISMAVVTFGKDGDRIAACEQVVFNNSDDDWPNVAAAVDRIRETVDLDDAVCIAALPDDWISHRTISMPFTDRKKINKIIAYEIEPLLPIPIGDLIVDFQPLAAFHASDPGNNFFTAVVTKARLKDFIEKLNTLGLEPEIITARGFAAASVWSAFKDSGLVVDGDDRHLVVSGFAGGKVRSVLSLPVGRPAGDRTRAFVDTLGHMLIADEERQQGDFAPEAVYLANALYHNDDIRETIESSLGVKAVRMDVAGLAALSAGVSAGAAGESSGGFDVALCLALVKRVGKPFVNLRKDEFAITGKWRQYSDVIIKTGLITVAVIIIGLSGFYYDVKNYREQISAFYSQRVEIFKDSFPQVPLVDDPLVQMRAEAGRLKGNIGLPPEMNRDAYCIDILNDISRLVPPGHDVVVERLVVGPDDVILSGSTDSFNAVDTLKSEFGKSALFGEIDISSATMNRVDKRVSFKLRLALR